MRLKLTLKVDRDSEKAEIPINYQYELASAIYAILAREDQLYSEQLHNKGFGFGSKSFKLFGFSWLFFRDYAIDKARERIILNSDTVVWYVSFAMPKSDSVFIKGVLQNSRFRLSDEISGVWFVISEIQLLPEFICGNTGEFRSLSPICVTKYNADKSTTYLHPHDERFEQGVLTGLLARYKVVYGEDYTGDSYCRIRTLSEPKSKLVRIKSGMTEETRVRGYMFDFVLELPEPLMEIAMDCGIGEKASMGFGMIHLKKRG